MIEETSELVAVIPMKPLSRSKTRLAPHMSEEQRSDLVVGMLRRVLGAIKGSSIEMFWVVGGDERIRNVARNFDGIWMEELGRNLNDTLGKAFDELAGRNAAALYLAGDLPFLKPSDLHSLLRSSRRNTNITLAPARRDGGTNAILVPPGIPFRPELGPRSFSKHLSTAAAMEVSVAICYSPGLGFDLDITDDLETFQHMEPGLIDRLSGRGPSSEQ
ncbi:MAG: 2-phospho-L-lactate guanylyltransferase [Dehalococcoidia bacterium]|nr:2-phospho-L-lactate guanylyltransferase [Dehalococcoidia bacterium]